MEKNAGISLLVLTILLVFTMVLHPAGGGVEYLIRITPQIVITHSIAILSLPFGWLGFWGLTRTMGTENFGSGLAFAMISLGLVAVLLAAATNGLVLPIFLQHYHDATPEKLSSIKPILRYSFAVNHAFDYIYTFAFCLAILSWSIVMIITKKFPVWLAWLGIALSITASIIFLWGVSVNNLQNFRLFVTTIIIWIALVGLATNKTKSQPLTNARLPRTPETASCIILHFDLSIARISPTFQCDYRSGSKVPPAQPFVCSRLLFSCVCSSGIAKK